MESAVRVREQQDRAPGYVNPAISGGRQLLRALAGRLSADSDSPSAEESRGFLAAAIVNDDDFKAWPIVCCARDARQLSSGTQSLYSPDDHAKERNGGAKSGRSS